MEQNNNEQGVIEQTKDQFGRRYGPYRVWFKGRNYPGLDISRSIGDFEGKKIGIIPNPEISSFNLNNSTKFIVICSDGVCEFINNRKIMNIGINYYLLNNAEDFCEELVKEAFHQWDENDNIIDDITAVVVFF